MIVGEAGGLVSFGKEAFAGFVMVKQGYLLPSGWSGLGTSPARTSLLAACMEGRLAEPLLFDGMCDASIFNAWLKTRRVPSAECPPPCDHGQRRVSYLTRNGAPHRSDGRDPTVSRALFSRPQSHRA